MCKDKGDKDMAIKQSTIKERLEELKSRAKKRQKNPSLRNIASSKELEIYSQNAKDLEQEQFKTIK